MFLKNKVSLEEFLKNQSNLIFGKTLVDYENVPRIIKVVFKKLKTISKEKSKILAEIVSEKLSAYRNENLIKDLKVEA